VAASQAINAHVNKEGRCAVCFTPFPCPVACLAEANLAALCDPPARHIPQLASRAAQPDSNHRPQRPVSGLR
jgi:hypothetical protein